MSALPLLMMSGDGTFEVSKDEALGVISASLQCFAETLADALTGSPPLGIAIGVPVVRRNIRRMASGEQYTVTFFFEGHPDPARAEGVSYGLDGSLAEEPIETHPEFQVLRKLYGGGKRLDASGHMIWPEFLSAGGEQVPNPMFGTEGYSEPGLVWTRTRTLGKLPPDLTSGLGAIETPPGNPPELAGRQVWIKIRATATFRGNVWQIVESWMLTGRRAIVPELYRRIE